MAGERFRRRKPQFVNRWYIVFMVFPPWKPSNWVCGLENGAQGRDYALDVAGKLAALDLRGD